MGVPDDKTTLKVLGALLILLILLIFGIPVMLYLALGTMTVVYVWYAVVFMFLSRGLVAYLLGDHDATPPPPVRKIGRIT